MTAYTLLNIAYDPLLRTNISDPYEANVTARNLQFHEGKVTHNNTVKARPVGRCLDNHRPTTIQAFGLIVRCLTSEPGLARPSAST